MKSVNPIEVLEFHRGTASRAVLLRHVSRRQLHTALQVGDIVSTRRGHYALPALPEPFMLAAHYGGTLSHQTAANYWGFTLLQQSSQVHITVNPGTRTPRSPKVHLYRRRLAPSEIDNGVTTPVVTALNCCHTLPFRDALAFVDSLRRDHPDLFTQLESAIHSGSSHRRNHCLRVLRWASTASDSPLESALRATLIEARFTSFAPQVPIVTAGGTFRVDLADVDRKVALEADSYQWHGGPSAHERDCRRYNELVANGWHVIRFTWDQVIFDPGWVVGIIRKVRRR